MTQLFLVTKMVDIIHHPPFLGSRSLISIWYKLSSTQELLLGELVIEKRMGKGLFHENLLNCSDTSLSWMLQFVYLMHIGPKGFLIGRFGDPERLISSKQPNPAGNC